MKIIDCQRIKKDYRNLRRAKVRLDSVLRGADMGEAGLVHGQLKDEVAFFENKYICITIDEAAGLFGDKFYGSEEMKAASPYFYVEGGIPHIPFTRRELKEAKERGEILILFPDKKILRTKWRAT